ncbi:MAG: rhodanese [Acidobacteria bacterium]|nr:rhodanese [Acidobacteriota bacterium]
MSPESQVRSATPAEIRRRLDRGEDLLLIDVREAEELAIASIEGALPRPLSRAAEWLDTLPREGEIVIFCHHGIRSMHAALALAQRGHRNLINLTGGIDLWSIEADPSIPRY